jgi:hypothetical protein
MPQGREARTLPFFARMDRLSLLPRRAAAQERLGSKIVVILVQLNLSLTTWWRSRQGFRSAARRRTGRVTATER